MSAHCVHADFDPVKAEAFAGRLLSALNNGALCLMVSVGHRTGLFDVMSSHRRQPPKRSPYGRGLTSVTSASGSGRW
jgi:hypothetical protein